MIEVKKMPVKAGKMLSWLANGLPLSFVLLFSVSAFAQMGGMSPGMGGMGPGMRPGMGAPGGHTDKDEGPAEVAPDAEAKAPANQEGDNGYLEQSRRKAKVVEFDGYFRFRSDYLYKMNLDQGYNANNGLPALPPFPTPSDCTPAGGGINADKSCRSRSLGTTNMRLRLEPTINVTDQVRVRTQFDIFDNFVLGTTPDSLVNPDIPDQNSKVGQTSAAAPTDVLSNTQVSQASNIIAKQAWAEIDSEIGSFRFGRMPWHFGRGMYFNRGNCADCEGGTTVDRVMFLTTVVGHQLALAWDLGAQGYHIGYTDLGQKNLGGFPLDLTQQDDVTQYMAALTKIDDDKTWRERLAVGDMVVNYGAQLVYRSQGYTNFRVKPFNHIQGTPMTSSDLGNTGDDASLTKINAYLFIPSIWFKLGWKALTLEFEGNALIGKMGNAGPLRLGATEDKGLNILQAGFVLAGELKLYNDSLFIGFETGGATGDQAELAYDPAKTGTGSGLYYPYLNYRWKFVPQPAGDKTLADFHFSPEYHVDEILFRRILGTVSNAIYVKPSIAYWFDLDSMKAREVGISGALIYSMAPVQVSTPGNSLSYGIEMDLGLQYRNLRDNVYAGFTWGVFWPFAALGRPRDSAEEPLWYHPESANASQVVRIFAGIRF
jgi:uncharacterized protein (TIGR04551 family)